MPNNQPHAAAVKAEKDYMRLYLAADHEYDVPDREELITREYVPLVEAAREMCELHSCECDELDATARPCEYCKLRAALKEVVG